MQAKISQSGGKLNSNKTYRILKCHNISLLSLATYDKLVHVTSSNVLYTWLEAVAIFFIIGLQIMKYAFSGSMHTCSLLWLHVDGIYVHIIYRIHYGVTTGERPWLTIEDTVLEQTGILIGMYIYKLRSWKGLQQLPVVVEVLVV